MHALKSILRQTLSDTDVHHCEPSQLTDEMDVAKLCPCSQHRVAQEEEDQMWVRNSLVMQVELSCFDHVGDGQTNVSDCNWMDHFEGTWKKASLTTFLSFCRSKRRESQHLIGQIVIGFWESCACHRKLTRADRCTVACPAPTSRWANKMK